MTCFLSRCRTLCSGLPTWRACPAGPLGGSPSGEGRQLGRPSAQSSMGSSGPGHGRSSWPAGVDDGKNFVSEV